MLKPRFTRDPLEEPRAFRKSLRDWFAAEGKDHPWRRTRDPYAILVSEVMLQQTQIATVLGRGFYTRFMDRFPDTASLAAAGDDELLKTWEGLGYYRRARFLREAARTVENDHGGTFPRDPAGLLALPGVGRYTAAAVLSFAWNVPAALVDGNVARVLSRLMDCTEGIDTGRAQRWLWEWADLLLDQRQPRIHNSALMELGQRICRPGVPDCLACPVAAFCRTREPEKLPRKEKRIAPTAINEHAIYARRGGSVLLSKLAEGRRVGMWRLPLREPGETSGMMLLDRRKYTITRYRVTLHLHAAGRVRARAGEVWQPLEILGNLAIPPTDRAALQAVLAAG